MIPGIKSLRNNLPNTKAPGWLSQKRMQLLISGAISSRLTLGVEFKKKKNNNLISKNGSGNKKILKAKKQKNRSHRKIA